MRSSEPIKHLLVSWRDIYGSFLNPEAHAVFTDAVVLWVSWQKLTFGKDIGTSTMSGYKKQLFSGGPATLICARWFETVLAVRLLREELCRDTKEYRSLSSVVWKKQSSYLHRNRKQGAIFLKKNQFGESTKTHVSLLHIRSVNRHIVQLNYWNLECAGNGKQWYSCRWLLQMRKNPAPSPEEMQPKEASLSHL